MRYVRAYEGDEAGRQLKCKVSIEHHPTRRNQTNEPGTAMNRGSYPAFGTFCRHPNTIITPPPLLLLPYLRTLDACFCLYHIHGHMQLPHAAYLHCISASHAEEFYRSFLSVSVGDVLGKGTNNKPHCDDPRTSPARLSKPADESIGEMHQACMSLSQA